MAAPTPPGPFIAPAAAPPGAVPEYTDSRLRSLGMTCIVLGAVEILYALFRIGWSVLSLVMAQTTWSAAGGGAGKPDPALDAMKDYMVTASLLDGGRILPFIVASVWLVFIGVRIRQGDDRALERARTWAWCALGVVLLSVALSMLSAVLMQQLQAQMLRSTPGGPSPPMGGHMELVSLIMGMTQALVGGAVMATWPVVLLLWTGKLRSERGAAAS